MSSVHRLMNKEEQQKILVEWNQTTREYARESTFHMLFEANARQSPDTVAVELSDTCLTYRELNSRANRLAHYLQKKGVSAETLVGLCVERGLDLVVGILGIHKAGGVYLPLDPAYPAERLQFMLDDALPPFIITQAGVKQGLPEYHGRVLCIDTDWPQIEREKDINPDPEITVDSLAYVIYTSGTTGQPKGTLLEHRGLSRVSAEQIRFFGVGPGSRVLQFSSPNFDASLFDIVMALASGATLVMAAQEELLPGPGLINLLREEAITILTVPPSVLNVLPQATLPELKIINVAGEACSAELVSRWAPGRRFFNLYGPTECTIWATVAECQPADGAPHIGRPIGNIKTYILNESLQPVPVGEPGELFIGGVGLARGYLNQESLTAEKFLADPFSSDQGTRMYRSGDRARYLEDGNIEFLGRVDEQIKIHGFRVEPGEIETVIVQQPDIDAAVVQVCDDDTGDRRLVAYIVLTKEVQKQKQWPGENALRQHLQNVLPAYMIPSAIVPLEQLPLTLNGKLDRQALPVPDWRQVMADTDYQPPRSTTEKMLADIYSEVLGVEHAGIRANFFFLGGHSLNVSQLIARVRELFKVELPFRSVFEHPVLSALAAEIDQLCSGESVVEQFIIEPALPGEPLPLSYSQERVWFVQQLDSANRAYNAQATIRWHGKLDVSALEQGLTEMVRRHQILRTTFIDDNGTPVQRIHPAEPVKLQIENLELSEPGGELGDDQPDNQAASQQRVNDLIQKAFHQPFDVTRLPLARWTLIRLNENEWLMTHVEHHMIHDGWSFNVFLGELLALYRAYHEGMPSPLPEPVMQFADFARWQRRWILGEEAAEQLAYWKQRLDGCQPLLELPYDRPRPAVQSFQGAAPRFELSAPLCEGIEKLCREAGVTPFMAFLTGLYILLYRYSSQPDICLGTGMANRRWQESEGLLGMIINNVVLRTDISGDPDVRELLQRVRECTLGASSNQDLPFEKVVEALQPERSLSYNPLFQVMFGMHDSPILQTELQGLSAEMDLAVANGGAKFDLTVVIIPASVQHVGLQQKPETETWTVIWEYSTDLFDAATASRMFSHYQRILQGMVSSLDCRLSQLPMQTDAEIGQLLLDWNQTATDYPGNNTVAALFEAQVQRTPKAVAVTYEGNTLTYSELNARANQLAHYLRSRGVHAEVMVGLYIERSVEMVEAIIAIMKAGGAYLPLDLDYPQSRLAYMLEDAQLSILLSMSSLKSAIPAFSGEVVCLDTDWPAIAKQQVDNPFADTTADSLAYVIYTSGSTGKPKGVMVAQRAICRLVCETDFFQVSDEDRVAQASNVSFDAATFEIWGALLNGAQLIGVSKDELLNPNIFSACLGEREITVLFITTALFNIMAQEMPRAFSNLRGLMFGGEAVDPEAVRQVLANGPPENLLHVYGPTECTTFATSYRVENVPTEATTVPIGRPISNTSAYILDEYMNPVPIGVAGELYLGGDGLAMGYFNQPQYSDEKFIKAAFSELASKRLYRTGDRVRYNRDSNIEFLGRFDQQVKLRGFRIEPGEIEIVLRRQSGVDNAVVVLNENEPGNKRLVAYVVPSQGKSPDINVLRERLQAELPAYMVPSVIMIINELPLTANGKVDRKSLPVPDASMLQSQDDFIEPRSDSEQRVAEIWKHLLNIERIGANDNFFNLGGHSLLATQMVSRLKSDFNLDVPLAVIFESPSVVELAACLDAAMLSAKANKFINEDSGSDRESGEI